MHNIFDKGKTCDKREIKQKKISLYWESQPHKSWKQTKMANLWFPLVSYWFLLFPYFNLITGQQQKQREWQYNNVTLRQLTQKVCSLQFCTQQLKCTNPVLELSPLFSAEDAYASWLMEKVNSCLNFVDILPCTNGKFRTFSFVKKRLGQKIRIWRILLYARVVIETEADVIFFIRNVCEEKTLTIYSIK